MIFFCPNSVSQYASIDPTIPPTPTMTTSASLGNLEAMGIETIVFFDHNKDHQTTKIYWNQSFLIGINL